MKLLKKELTLCASVLSYLFIAFGLMFFLPGYPVLCGAFFVTLGIFQSFQKTVANNDILFSVLLPVSKRDVVKGKYLFSCLIELCGFALMALATVLRMTVLKDSPVYRNNALMNANPFALGLALLIFGLFNAVFIGGFFQTSRKFGKPFVLYAVSAFLTIAVGETLHHIPGLGKLNAFGFECAPLQLALLAAGAAGFALITCLSCRKACKSFENTDL